MRTEMAALEGRHREAKKVLELLGRCGPAFGMIATLLGLILMLGNLDSPDTIGPSMAVALIGTLYGAVLANLICIPLGEKLSFLSREELLLKEIIIGASSPSRRATIPASSARNSIPSSHPSIASRR